MSITAIEKTNLSFYDVRQQLHRYVQSRSEEAFAAGNQARDAVRTIEQLHERQRLIRESFLEAIGGLPETDAPLQAAVTGGIDCGEYRIEHVVFQSRPQVYVTCNMYIPHGLKGPAGTVLFLCGHNDQAKHSERYHTVCQFLVRAGLVVLAMDPIGQGERLNYYESAISRSVLTESYEHEHPGTQIWPLGGSLARYFVHDAMRAIDYLLTRPEVDGKKIGVTGSSGGGTQTAMLMMCDSRIAAAAPGTYVTSRQSYLYANQPQDAEQIWPGFTSSGLDHEDFLIAMAPRPVRILAVTYDIFPIEGSRRTVERTRRFWDMFGRGDDVDLFEDAALHMYTNRLAQAAAEFFSAHLLGTPRTPEVGDIQVVPAAKLKCTAAGQVRSEYGDARSVHDEIVERLDEIERERREKPAALRKEEALSWLRGTIIGSRPECPANPRHGFMRWQIDELQLVNSLWWSQPGLFNYGLFVRDYRFRNDELPVTIAVWDGGTGTLRQHWPWIRKTCGAGNAVLVLDVTGSGVLQPYPFYASDALAPYGTLSKATTDLMFLGDSLAAIRTHDVLRTLDLLAETPLVKTDEGVRLYAHGRHGLHAELAAALDARFSGVEIVQPMESVSELVRNRHYEQYDAMGLMLPGMLRYFDLPELRSWREDQRSISAPSP